MSTRAGNAMKKRESAVIINHLQRIAKCGEMVRDLLFGEEIATKAAVNAMGGKGRQKGMRRISRGECASVNVKVSMCACVSVWVSGFTATRRRRRSR